VVFLSGAVSDQLYSIMLDTPPDGDERHDPDAVGEIGGISPPNTLEIRWMPAAGGASTLVAAAQNGRRPHFVQRDSSRIYLSGSRGLQSIDISGYDRRTVLRVTGSGAGNNPPAADEIRLSPDGARAFVSLQGKHFVCRWRRPAARLSRCASRAGETRRFRSAASRRRAATIWAGRRTASR
jgi:hypothetical protein